MQMDGLSRRARPRSEPAAIALARRDFLKACAALAAVSGCSSLAANTRLAQLLLDEPHPDRVRPVQQGLVAALLAFDDPHFPVPPAVVQARLAECFPLESEPEFLPLRRALMLFDAVALFPERLALTLDAERARLGARGLAESELEQELERAQALDAAAFRAQRSLAGAERFSALPLAAQRDYLKLWARSAFVLRRRFYRTTKSLAMIATYSLPDVWREIGYEGPLLSRA